MRTRKRKAGTETRGAAPALATCLAAWALLLGGPSPLPGAAVDLPPDATPEGRILMLEDQRVLDLEDGFPDLKHYLKSSDPDVRARAALAAGRIRDPGAVPLLRRALRADQPRVRRAAAFALGVASLRRSRGALVRALRDPDAEVRALAAEALSKSEDPKALSALLRHLRLEAPESDARVLERLLLTAWRGKPEGWTGDVLALLEAEGTAESVKDAAVFFLMRRPDPEAREALEAVLSGKAPVTRRSWAARALGRIDHPHATWMLLGACDEAQPVAIEALRALHRHPRAAGTPQLLAAAHRPELHVRLAALQTIQALGRPGDAETSYLLQAKLGVGGAEAAEALAALARVDPVVALPHLQTFGTLSPDWRIRAAAADALGSMKGKAAEEILSLLLEDEDPRVVWHTVAAYAERIGDPPEEEAASRAAEVAHHYLNHEDVVVRAVAAGTLRRSGQGTFEEFASCFLGALGDPHNDAALACLEAAAEVADPDEKRRGLERVMQSPDPVIRLRGGRLWEEHMGVFPRWLVYPVRRNQERRFTDEEELRAYSALAAGGLLPRRVLVSYEGGVFIADLFVEDAPLTIHNLAKLGREGYFEGLEVHRVVPNFVFQNGDPRGDGWGGPGFSIRDEINTRRYKEGTLGMALSGRDTGGSQWFITLSPQPHLDGGYTVFGRVISGLETLQSVAPGARILGVRVAE